LPPADKLSDHPVDGDQWTNQLDRGCDIFAFKTAAIFSNLDGVKFVDTDELTVFPNPRVGIVRTDGVDLSRYGSIIS
jgi:hypothetical protein